MVLKLKYQGFSDLGNSLLYQSKRGIRYSLREVLVGDFNLLSFRLCQESHSLRVPIDMTEDSIEIEFDVVPGETDLGINALKWLEQNKPLWKVVDRNQCSQLNLLG